MLKNIYNRLFHFEKLAIIYFVFIWVLRHFYKFKINYMIEYFFYQLFGAFCLGYLMVCIYCIFLAIRYRNIHRGIEEVRQRYLNFNFLIESFRIITTVTVILILFCNLKQIIPLINPRLFDNTFWRMDIALHLGHSPTLLFLKIPYSSWFWPFIDRFYVTFFIKNMIIPWVFILQTKSVRLRHRFILAVCLCWIIGGLSYYLFPGLGPCYFKRDLFHGLNIPIAKSLQHSLLVGYISFRDNPLIYRAETFSGIAAMPSLHIAIVALFFIFSLKLNRILASLILVYAILMFCGSIMLGWDYAIDGYAGVALAVLVYFISCYICKK